MPKKKLDPIPAPSGVMCHPLIGFVQGLPLTNMTMQEWESYPADLRADGLATGVYTLTGSIDPIEEVNPVDEALAIEEAT